MERDRQIDRQRQWEREILFLMPSQPGNISQILPNAYTQKDKTTQTKQTELKTDQHPTNFQY